MSLLQIVVIAVAFIVAGIAKGAIGMGMPPIAIGLMSFALPLESAIAIMVLPTMFTNIWQAIYGGGFVVLMRRFGADGVRCDGRHRVAAACSSAISARRARRAGSACSWSSIPCWR